MPRQGSVEFFSAAITTATDTTLVTVASGRKFRLTGLLVGNTSITAENYTLKAATTVKWGGTAAASSQFGVADNENGFFEGADGEDLVVTTASGVSTFYIAGTVEIFQL